ncbi:hypothetical protein CTA1_8849, partial [Colletotrichum tanaceti]
SVPSRLPPCSLSRSPASPNPQPPSFPASTPSPRAPGETAESDPAPTPTTNTISSPIDSIAPRSMFT